MEKIKAIIHGGDHGGEEYELPAGIQPGESIEYDGATFRYDGGDLLVFTGMVAK